MPRPDELLEQKQTRECICQLVAALPPAQCEVILLHDLQGYTDPEVAQMLGLTLANVKIRLHRARARLRTALAQTCHVSRDERGILMCELRGPEVPLERPRR